MSTTPFEHLSSDFWAFANQYIGTKEIEAIPMTRGEYNSIRGWLMPTGENPNDGGYIVRYPGGYVSWSPEFEFDSAYGLLDNMNFGDALHFLKDGNQIARAGWNGAGMFVYLVKGHEGEGGTVMQPFAMFCTATQSEVPWLCSQSDMLANDWFIHE